MGASFMNRLGLIMVFFAVVGIATSLQAQSSQVSGQILDPSQAAIPGAEVTLIQTETGARREITSSSEGYYSFPLLLPGHYELRVQKEGFAAQKKTGIVVETASITTVDVTLGLGSETQTVNVDASVPLLETESSAVSHVIENQTITNMPLLDRRSAQ